MTLRLKYLIANCVLALTVGAANADTFDQFDVQGTASDGSFSGTFTVDENTGAVSNVNIDFPALSFFDVFVTINASDQLEFTNTPPTPTDTLLLGTDGTSLIGFAGSPITGGNVSWAERLCCWRF